MKTLSNIIRGQGVAKTLGNSQPRQFLIQRDSNRNSWFNRRRYVL